MTPRLFTADQDAEIAELRRSGLSLVALTEKYGCSLPPIRASLKRSGFETSRGRPKWREFTQEQIVEMGQMWEDGKSQSYIATKFGTTQTIVSGVLKGAGFFPERRFTHVSRERHYNWRGGKIKVSGGYTAVLLDRGSPFWPMVMSNQGYVLEHRLVMAKSLDRPLRPDETVHHINGDRTDNRLENLQVRQGKHGKGEAMECGDCGSHNIVHVTLT